ncbi:MAG: GxxExxY protein [Gemmatimonadaceae bacterium]
MPIHDCSRDIISAAIKVHSILGPGLLEATYKRCLAIELRKRGFRVEEELELPVVYEGVCVDLAYRIDILVNGVVIVEVKAIATVLPVHHAQLLSYLRTSGHKIGLLINFNVRRLREGISRTVNAL